MNIKPLDNNNDDWFDRFFDFGIMKRRISRGSSGLFDVDTYSIFDDMEKEMGRIFGQFKEIQTNAPKHLVREYQAPNGTKVKEVGPLVYGSSMTVGPDGKPKVREFGNVRPLAQGEICGNESGMDIKPLPLVSAEREPLADVNTTDKEIKVVLEIPGVKKEDIMLSANDQAIEVTANNPQRKYHKTIDLPKEANIETARSTYHNGILEITFSKRENSKPKGKEIKIE